MAVKQETTFYRSILKHLPSSLYRLKMYNPFVAGPADHWVSGPTADVWIEWKWLTVPKRPATRVTLGLTGPQSTWLEERSNEGRNVIVIAGCKAGGVIFTERSWEVPITQKEFVKRLVDRKSIAAWIEEKTCG